MPSEEVSFNEVRQSLFAALMLAQLALKIFTAGQMSRRKQTRLMFDGIQWKTVSSCPSTQVIFSPSENCSSVVLSHHHQFLCVERRMEFEIFLAHSLLLLCPTYIVQAVSLCLDKFHTRASWCFYWFALWLAEKPWAADRAAGFWRLGKLSSTSAALIGSQPWGAAVQQLGAAFGLG